MWRSGLRRFVDVPDTWEGWAVRVLTIAVVLMIITTLYLTQQVAELHAYIQEGRAQRQEWQQVEAERVCVVLRQNGSNDSGLKELGC